MLTDKDIRVGNWFLANATYGNDKYVEVQNIYNDAINIYENYRDAVDVGVFIDRLTPIPITTNKLEECGMKKLPFLDTICYGFYYCRHRENEPHQTFAVVQSKKLPDEWEAVVQSNRNKMRVSLNSIQYIHQLQNLVFDITGTELKFNFGKVEST